MAPVNLNTGAYLFLDSNRIMHDYECVFDLNQTAGAFFPAPDPEQVLNNTLRRWA